MGFVSLRQLTGTVTQTRRTRDGEADGVSHPTSYPGPSLWPKETKTRGTKGAHCKDFSPVQSLSYRGGYTLRRKITDFYRKSTLLFHYSSLTILLTRGKSSIGPNIRCPVSLSIKGSSRPRRSYSFWTAIGNALECHVTPLSGPGRVMSPTPHSARGILGHTGTLGHLDEVGRV